MHWVWTTHGMKCSQCIKSIGSVRVLERGMNRCSFREWMPILPWPVWPLAGQCRLGQNVVVGSMIVLLAVCGSRPRGVCLDPIFVTSEFHHGQMQSYRKFD